MSGPIAAILQSGFVLHTDDGLSLFPEKDQATLIDEARHGSKISFDRNPYFYDVEIDAVFKEFVTNGNKLSRDFRFRELVFKEILASFKGISFKDWISLQRSSNTLTDMHVRYLDDTLRFLQGNRRQMNNESWWHILEVRQDREGKPPIDFNFESYFDGGRNDLSSNAVPMFMRDAIVRWVSRTGGFEDLVYFAGIVLASRPDTKRF